MKVILSKRFILRTVAIVGAALIAYTWFTVPEQEKAPNETHAGLHTP
jgi:hypothetical protein